MFTYIPITPVIGYNLVISIISSAAFSNSSFFIYNSTRLAIYWASVDFTIASVIESIAFIKSVLFPVKSKIFS